MKQLYFWCLIVCGAFLHACNTPQSPAVSSGIWRATLQRDGRTLPFQLEIEPNAGQETYTVYAINGSERLKFDTAYVQNDSLHIPMQLFDSELIGKIEQGRLSGVWRVTRVGKLAGELPFEAVHDQHYRFFEETPGGNPTSVDGKWSTVFRDDASGDTTVSVGIFEQKGAVVKGTFLTPTGDYRYLAGNVKGDSLFLSCFDGSHAFLFEAALQSDGTLKGNFWSGLTGFESWTAHRDARAELPDANTLTYLKPGYETLDFTFPDADGKRVSLRDPRFQNKVVVVQIMGSWCPNCMDETRFLSPWYKKNRNRGVEVVGLAFERSARLEDSAPKLRRMSERYELDYPVLLAGLSDKDSAATSLPMLNHVMSFPTTIVLDKKGKVRNIHTGFSGPGTGRYYDEFVQDFNQLIDKLLNE